MASSRLNLPSMAPLLSLFFALTIVSCCPLTDPSAASEYPDGTGQALQAPVMLAKETPTFDTHLAPPVQQSIAIQYLPSDCSDYFEKGQMKSGVYKIFPKYVQEPIDVYCDMETDGGGWTVFQRRNDYGEPRQDFYLGWNEYKKGFGDLNKEFWLGNDNLFALTNQKKMTLRVDLQDFAGERRNATYEEFLVRPEREQYMATFWNYTGNAGDSMTAGGSSYSNNTAFSTKDRDNDKSVSTNFATRYRGGWWYGDGMDANLNGIYYPKEVYEAEHPDGLDWYKWKNHKKSMKFTEMKVRRKSFKVSLP